MTGSANEFITSFHVSLAVVFRRTPDEFRLFRPRVRNFDDLMNSTGRFAFQHALRSRITACEGANWMQRSNEIRKNVGIGGPRQLLWREVLFQADRLNRPRTS